MSILKHQKRLWFVAGAIFGGLGLYALEKEAWQGVASVSAHLHTDSTPLSHEDSPEPMFGPQFWNGAARQWNSGVDAVFQPIISRLSDRGL